MEGSGDLRIVLVGKTGAGKSSTANSILGENLLRTSCRANSDTATCVAATNTVDGRKITVVDTPGYFCTECPDEKLKPEIARCIVECSPGPHTFLIVLPVRRHTEEENKAVEEIPKTFGEEALKYAVVLFTHGDQLDDNVTIQQFVDGNNHLKTLVQKCGNRLHVIDNKYWKNPSEGHDDERCNAVQIKKLLNTIDQMVKQNGGKHYTNEMLQAVEQAIEEEMAKGKTREMAKESVMKKFLIRLAGITAGSLCGALLGTDAGSAAIDIAKAIKSCDTEAIVLATVHTVNTVASMVGKKSALRPGFVDGVSVSVGAITGGITGANAVSEAETVGEGVKRAIFAVTGIAEGENH